MGKQHINPLSSRNGSNTGNKLKMGKGEAVSLSSAPTHFAMELRTKDNKSNSNDKVTMGGGRKCGKSSILIHPLEMDVTQGKN